MPLRVFAAFLSMVFFSLSAHAETLQQRVEAVNTLTENMIRACTLGQKISVRLEAEGALSVTTPGAQGRFVADKTEIPSIMEFLRREDRLVVSQQAMKCTEKYFAIIIDFANINSPNVIQRPIALPFYEDANLIIHSLGCSNSYDQTQCRFSLSLRRDMRVAIKGDTRLIDSVGNNFLASTVKLGNKSGSVARSKRAYVYDDLFVGPKYDVAIIFSGKVESGSAATIALKVNSYRHFVLREVPVR